MTESHNPYTSSSILVHDSHISAMWLDLLTSKMIRPETVEKE